MLQCFCHADDDVDLGNRSLGKFDDHALRRQSGSDNIGGELPRVETPVFKRVRRHVHEQQDAVRQLLGAT